MPEALAAHIDLLVVNEIEAEMLARTGPVDGVAAALSAAAVLLSRVPRVIVTLGGRGLVLASRDAAPVVIPGHPVRVESTHGAGDAFIGALAARLAQDAPLEAAARHANAAAAVLVATPEPLRAALTEADTLRLLDGP
jgi:ribokinase